MRAARVDAQVRRRVRRLAQRVEPLHLRPVGGERPAAVGRQPRDQFVQRHVEPDREAVHVDGGAVLRVHERPAPGGDDGMPQRQQQPQDLALHRAKMRFAALHENLRHRPALARLDQLVDVVGAPAQARRDRPRHGGLAGGHEADEIDLIGRHRSP
jgi:hypothetical protein